MHQPTPSPAVPTAADHSAQLLTKLHKVYKAVQFVEKRGHNPTGKGYSFAQALDVVRDVRAALVRQKIVVVPGAVDYEHERIGETRGGAPTTMTTVRVVYRFMDAETGAFVEVPWIGTGVDHGGEKGIYKAYTGGLKYALLSLFLLPMTDDPEHDGFSRQPEEPAPAQAPETTVDKDADRPAAPRIPLDRARSIADAAVAANLASWGEGEKPALIMTPVLKAQLGTLGVSQIGALNVDQAEVMDAFIADEYEAAQRGEQEPVDQVAP